MQIVEKLTLHVGHRPICCEILFRTTVKLPFEYVEIGRDLRNVAHGRTGAAFGFVKHRGKVIDPVATYIWQGVHRVAEGLFHGH